MAKREKIELRITHEQKELVRAAAEKAGMTISGWLLRSAMMDDIPHRPGSESDILQRRTISDAEELGPLLRDIRVELTGIRTRLDGLAGIHQQLRYQSQRMEGLEKRFATLLETKLDGPKVTPALPAGKLDPKADPWFSPGG